MTPWLTTTAQLQRPIDPGFCYLCGKSLDNGATVNTQHVVPRALFSAEDRDDLLKFRAHSECNTRESMNDQDIGQLVGLLHRTPELARRHSDRLRRKTSFHEVGHQRFAAVEHLPLRLIIYRWVQGFHAALYGEFLAMGVDFAITEPFPGGDQPGKADPILPQHFALVDTIKKNRAADRIDRIEYANGKCLYHCTWDKLDPPDCMDICIFALDLYDWAALGDPRFGHRSCVGSYIVSTPPAATVGTTVEIVYSNVNRADAFAP